MDWIIEIIKKYTKDGVVDFDGAQREINNETPKHVVPKNLYIELSKEKKALDAKVKEYEDSKLTDEQKQQKVIDDAQAEKEKYQKMSNKLEVEKIFIGAGIQETEYAGFIDAIVGVDAEVSKATATSMANAFKAKTTAAEEKFKNDLLKETPRPAGDDGNNGDGKNNKLSTSELKAKEIAQTLGKGTLDLSGFE